MKDGTIGLPLSRFRINRRHLFASVFFSFDLRNELICAGTDGNVRTFTRSDWPWDNPIQTFELPPPCGFIWFFRYENGLDNPMNQIGDENSSFTVVQDGRLPTFKWGAQFKSMFVASWPAKLCN